jgi:inorganic phosphate transporter, PiT family
MNDLGQSETPPLALGVFAQLAVALLIALGFEFVNGFHDTANAVATVIYTHSLPAQAAVVWSGCWNLIGVVTSSGAVAFGSIIGVGIANELMAPAGSATSGVDWSQADSRGGNPHARGEFTLRLCRTGAAHPRHC